MINILRIDSSARPVAKDASETEGSYSRRLTDHLLTTLGQAHGPVSLVTRDLATDPIPHIANQTIEGYYTPPEAMTDALREATALSDRLIGELKDADILVLSVPIYNFSIPSALKAWIDQIVRMGHTFAYEDGAFRGLLEGKRAYVCFAYGAGGYLNDGPLAAYDHMSPYVNMILNFIGITEVKTFGVEATTADADTISAELDRAFANVDQKLAA